MVSLTKGFAALDLATGVYTMVASPDTDPRNRFNDGKCDPQYSSLTSSFDFQHSTGGAFGLVPWKMLKLAFPSVVFTS
jgi:hypothetical protein